MIGACVPRVFVRLDWIELGSLLLPRSCPGCNVLTCVSDGDGDGDECWDHEILAVGYKNGLS